MRCCLTLLGLALALCGTGVSCQPDLDLRHRRLLQRVYDLGLAAQVRPHERRHRNKQEMDLHSDQTPSFIMIGRLNVNTNTSTGVMWGNHTLYIAL